MIKKALSASSDVKSQHILGDLDEQRLDTDQKYAQEYSEKMQRGPMKHGNRNQDNGLYAFYNVYLIRSIRLF